MENYVGKRIDGRYEIQDVVGVGGMAVVYKAYDNIDDRIVAVKILKDEYLANEEFRRRFKNESKAIAVLNHRNIVKVYDVSFGDRLQYIVMEYIEGISLKEYIQQQGVIDWNEALFFGIQILRALQHAHDKGIVHRDVKPQNIMLLENGTIKVTDFGIARFSHGETRTMTEKAIGSVHYISPEQAKGELTDEKADIYSVGIVLYEMLTGKLPFEAENAVSVALMQVNNEAVLPRTINAKIPLGFEQITMKAMQKSTRERYQTAAEMLLDLEELKRNPNIKFDYVKYFVDEQPTRYVGKIQGNMQEAPKTVVNEYPPKPRTVPPANINRQRMDVNGASVQNQRNVAAQNEQDKSAKKKVIALSVSIVCILLFLIIFVAFYIKNNMGQKLVVDNFVGLNYEQQILNNSLYEGKYVFNVTYESFSDGKEGTVFKQDPEAGTVLKEGTVIHLFVAKSGEGVEIPDFSGQYYLSVGDELESMGFIVQFKKEASDIEKPGNVLRTDPAAGSKVFPGSSVYVIYAVNDDEPSFNMPNLFNMSYDEAKREIESKGLVLGNVKYVNSPAEKDTVIGQTPKDGSAVIKGEVVDLTLSSGKTEFSKTIDLPQNIGVVSIEVFCDGISVSSQSVDTKTVSQYNIKVEGDKYSKIKVTINRETYYEVSVDFASEPVKEYDEKFEQVSFYIDVVGMDIESAKKALAEVGFTNVVTVESISGFDEGIVIGQTPSPNSDINYAQNTEITLTVAVSGGSSSGNTDTSVGNSDVQTSNSTLDPSNNFYG